MVSCFRVVVAILSGIFAFTAGTVHAEGFLERLLPAWPIVNPGDSIPDDLIRAWAGGNPKMGQRCAAIAGQFRAFPSKGNTKVPDDKDKAEEKGEWDSKDPDSRCDDGDLTLYNGMLCASGVLDGCRSIADAQDSAGRMYRSPHRRWLWAERCDAYKADPKFKTFYDDRCANGFSPDMSLGVLLYALKTKDTERYQHWLVWLDDFAKTTQLCKKGDDGTFYDCQQIDWPRVCPEDKGYRDDKEINGRYGGNCVLRPTDAMDFAAVNDALSIAPPPRMNKWDAQSRLLIKGVEATANGVVPIGSVFSRFPLIVLSTVDARNFPAHLDAIRVLIRMMILNPSLELTNLPPMPNPSDLVPGVLDAAVSDSTDILSINVAAKALALQDGDNPFYALLSEGPTSSVRSKIIKACPDANGDTDASNWLWEKGPGEKQRDKKYSMGWDCVFVATLFNKMRVRKDLADELLDRSLKLADPTEKILNNAGQALQAAEAANKIAEDAFNVAERNLSDASDFVNGLYDQRRQAAKAAIDELTKRIADLSKQISKLEGRISELRNQALTMPDTIAVKVEREVCKWLPGDVGSLCNKVVDVQQQVNQAKAQVLNQITSIEGQIRDIRDNQISAAQAEIRVKTQQIADLDAKLQSVRRTLENKTLDATARLARETLKQTSKTLYEARKLTATAKRAWAHLKGNLSVWKNDPKEVVDVDLTPVPPVTPPSLPPQPEPKPPGLKLSGPKSPADHKPPHQARSAYYVIVASLHTRRAAQRQVALFHRRDRNTRYRVLLTHVHANCCVVSSGSSPSLRKARTLVSDARKRHIANDAYVLRLWR